MENQNEKSEDFNKNQAQQENEWSQKNEPYHDQSDDANQQRNQQNSQNQDSNATDGPWSQDRNTDQSQRNNMDQQREGSDADYAESIPGTQNSDGTGRNVGDLDDTNNADRENRGSLDGDERSRGSAL